MTTRSKASTTRKSSPTKAADKATPEVKDEETGTEAPKTVEGENPPKVDGEAKTDTAPKIETDAKTDETPAGTEAPTKGMTVDQPSTDTTGMTVDDGGNPSTEGERVAAPRKTPAAAELDGPPAPPSSGSLSQPRVVADHSGQLSVDMVTDKPAELKSELYDARTGKSPDVDEMFVLETPHGGTMICRVRLCERVWAPGLKSPNSRLVMPQGQRTDKAFAERIVAIVKHQQGIVDEPEGDEQS